MKYDQGAEVKRMPRQPKTQWMQQGKSTTRHTCMAHAGTHAWHMQAHMHGTGTHAWHMQACMHGTGTYAHEVGPKPEKPGLNR